MFFSVHHGHLTHERKTHYQLRAPTFKAICFTRVLTFCNFALPPFDLIFVFVEEEILFCGIIGPNIFDTLVDIAFVFNLLQVL